MKRIMRVLLCAIVFIAIVISISAEGQQEEETVKIGALAPLTGGKALLGQRLVQGFEIAVDMINESGGVWQENGEGKMLELVKGDASDVQAAMNEAERLIQQEKVQVIIDGHLSSNAMVVSKVCEQNDTIYIATVGIMDPITERGYKNLYRITVLASTFGRDSVRFVEEHVSKEIGIAPEDMKVAVIHEDSGYGSSVGGAAKEAVEESPMDLVYYESYTSGTNDLTSLIMQLKDKQPDVVVATQYPHDGLLFWEQAESLGFNVQAYVGTGAIHSMPDWIEGTGEKGNYVFSYELGFISPENLSEKGKALSLEFRKRYDEKFGGFPPTMSVIGFQGAYTFFTEMLDPAGSTECDAIHKAAARVDIAAGDTIYGFGVKFDPETHQNERAVGCIYQWLDGKFTIVWPSAWADKEPVLPMPTWDER